MDMQKFLTQVKEQNEQKKNEADTDERYLDSIRASDGVQRAVVETTQALINFLEKQVGKTEITNFPEPVTSISTPDVAEVTKSIDRLTKLTEGKKTDLTPVIQAIQGVGEQIKNMPRELPEYPQPHKEVIVENLGDTVAAINKLQKALEAKKLQTNVDVKAPDVNIDLDSIEKALKSVEKSIKAIKIPEVPQPEPVDFKPISKQLKELSKLMEQVRDRPMPVPQFKTKGIQLPIHDYGTVTYNTATRETYTFKRGGASGTTVGTMVINYTDSTKDNLENYTLTLAES